MRFKIFYQQLFSHFGIVIVAFLGISLFVSHYVENLVFQYKEEELTTFGNKILEDLGLTFFDNQLTLEEYRDILSERGIEFSIFNAKGQFIYPEENRKYRIVFNEDEWENILQGKTIVDHVDYKRFGMGVTFVIIPYRINDVLFGGVLLFSPIEGINELISKFNDYLLITVAVATLVTFLLSWFSSKFHVRRINELKQATSVVASGSYDINVSVSDYDEIGELAQNFTLMVEKLKKSREEIESLENRRRQFIADVSHEMRTPLTTISGVIEGLKNDLIPESEKEKGLELVSKETKRLIRLVNENLDYEKIRSNQVTLEKERIELGEVLEIISEQLQLVAEEKGNQIIIEIEGTPFVYADYDRLVQILLNISKNSIQFTDDGTIYLRGKEKDGYCIIEIEDTGIGIEADEIENIWRRFYKADISRKSNPFGEFGLGLSIVKKLVELHNGKIYVESEKGKGTKFTIYFPLHEKGNEEEVSQ